MADLAARFEQALADSKTLTERPDDAMQQQVSLIEDLKD